MKVLTVAWLTFREAQTRRLLHLVLVMALLFLLLFAVGFWLAHTRSRFSIVGERSEVTNFLLLAGLYATNFLGVVLAVVVSADTISGDIESGAIHTIVTKPIRRWHVVLGKWLGLSLLVAAVLIAVALGMVGIGWLISGYTPPHFGQGVALMVLGSLVLLTLSILAGTRFSTLINGVFVFMLYGLAFMGNWIEQIGSFLQSQPAVYAGILVSFLMPGEAMWTRASYLMQPTYLRELGFSPFAAGSAPSQAMVVYAVVYCAVVLALAVNVFSRRDL